MTARELETDLDALPERALAQFRASCEEWFQWCEALVKWEHDGLAEAPTLDAMARHSRYLRNLDWFGRLLLAAAEYPTFQRPRSFRTAASAVGLAARCTGALAQHSPTE